MERKAPLRVLSGFHDDGEEVGGSGIVGSAHVMHPTFVSPLTLAESPSTGEHKRELLTEIVVFLSLVAGSKPFLCSFRRRTSLAC